MHLLRFFATNHKQLRQVVIFGFKSQAVLFGILPGLAGSTTTSDSSTCTF